MSWSGFTKSQEKGSKFSLGKITKQQWLVLLLVGVLLAVMALPVKKNETNVQDSSNMTWTKTDQGSSLTQKERMERQLEETLSQVEGVGEVKVMLSVQEKTAEFYGDEEAPQV